MHRAKQTTGMGLKMAAYAGAGTAVGVLAGAALGLLGSWIEPATRAVIVVCLALVALFLALVELAGRRLRIIQVDRETPYGWLGPGPLSWAAKNGAAIGFGAGTRLGFWLWYAIPLGALLAGNPLVGALGYGLYSLTRTLGAGAIIVMVQRAGWTARLILDQSIRARAASNYALLALAVTAIVIVGS